MEKYIILLILAFIFAFLLFLYIWLQPRDNLSQEPVEISSEEPINNITQVEESTKSDDSLSEDIIYPTMHSKCNINAPCGGDLVCDSNRCKQQIGGNCSSDVDCQKGLVCDNWICRDSENIVGIPDNIELEIKSKKKKVRWDDLHI